MFTIEQDALQSELKKKRICRFCLSQNAYNLTNIFMRDTRIKSSAPLPIQIMAIASIEVFSNDGMPPFLCSDCIHMFEYCYQFKQMCKKADNLLRQFPLTGKWPQCLEKPVVPQFNTAAPPKANKTTQACIQHNPNTSIMPKTLSLPKKILNSSVNSKPKSASTELTLDITPNHEHGTESDCTITFLYKIENNEELSIDDIQQLVAAEDKNEAEFEKTKNLALTVEKTEDRTNKPKLLNKSSIRILNKSAEPEREPQLSLPKIKQDEDGKMEVVTEIINIEDINAGEPDPKNVGEPDPKNAAPIETDVFPCSHCERSFPLLQLRDIHMKVHLRDRNFQCEHCEKSFFSKYDLQRHLFTHNGEKPYKCSVCGKTFARSSLLARHEKGHIDVPKYVCSQCERPFISKDDLEKHMERHNINRPFRCKTCDKGFAFKQGVERHEVIHLRQQPFSCHYCDESFSTTSKLARHLTAHAGQRPYPCKYCNKSYLLSHHLARHLRSHRYVVDPANTISFTCMRCNTCLSSRDELIKHTSIHANEMNLTCSLCKDVFNTMPELNSHLQEHSKGDTFACEFCDLIFMTADKLESHTYIDHAQEMEAYYADDHAQAVQQMENLNNQQNNIDSGDEKSQDTENKYPDELVHKENTSQNLLKRKIKEEKPTPTIVEQVIIQAPIENQKKENRSEGNDDSLVPLKKSKLDLDGKNAVTQPTTSDEIKQSPQLRRKTSNRTRKSVTTIDVNQPTINSLLKQPKVETKTSPTKTGSSKTGSSKTSSSKTASSKGSSSKSPPKKMIVADPLPAPKIIKLEKESTAASTSSTSDDKSIKVKAEPKKVKLQKITVTKAQAAAMAKEGRIKIKDGKIILKQ